MCFQERANSKAEKRERVRTLNENGEMKESKKKKKKKILSASTQKVKKELF
jgi:hypothetical protein